LWKQIELSRGVKVGRTPPGEAELAALHRDGVRAVIDLRTDAEPPGAHLGPTEEADLARAYGMEAIRIPVTMARVGKADLDAVGEALRNAPKPVLIHCASGKRAGMIALVHTAIETGTPGAEMLEIARHLDVAPADPVQRRIYSDYVDQRETRPEPLLRREEALRVDGRPIPLLPEATRRLVREARLTPVRRWLGREHGLLGRRFVRPGTDSSFRLSLGTAAAVAGALLLACDRRLRVPLLIAAGIAAGRAVAMSRARPPVAPSPQILALDHDIAELERRVHDLRQTA